MPSSSQCWRGLQQRRGIDKVDPELGRQRQLGMFGRNAQADQQAQISRGSAVFIGGRLDHLGQLFKRIEAEGTHAVGEVGFAYGARSFDRVHEAQLRLGQHGTHHAHLADRGDVVVRHAVVPQDADEVWRGIRLDRIHRRAGEVLDKETRRPRSRLRPRQNDRLVRRKGADYSLCVRKMVQFKGPPKALNRQEAALRWESLGAAEARI